MNSIYDSGARILCTHRSTVWHDTTVAEGLSHKHLVRLEWPFQVGIRARDSMHSELGVEGAERQRAFEGAAPWNPICLNEKNASFVCIDIGIQIGNLRDGADPTH